jgi:hypothetical protein
LDVQNIITELKGELTRIGQVIGLLENGTPVKKRVGRPPGSAAEKVQTKGPGLGLTPAGRRKLSESMKRRWGQRSGATSASKSTAKVAAATIPKKTGGISAAGRKKLSEAMKKRWAEKKRKA